MKKLTVCLPEYGDKCLTEPEAITEEFERIMEKGYGNNVPAVFHADMKDGSHEIAKGKDAEKFLRDPNVEEVTVIAPLVGG